MALTQLPRRRGALWLLCLLCWSLAGCLMPVAQPSPTATPTSLPATPTPLPITAADLWQRALASSEIGDDDTAASLLSQLLQLFPAAAEAPLARLMLARSYGDRGNWTSAAELVRPLLGDPATPLYAPALFLTARAHEAAGMHAEAVAAYTQYEALGTPLAPYAALRAAAQLRVLERWAEAEASYLRAATGEMAAGQRAAAYEQAMALAAAQGRPADAVDYARQILAFATQPDYRSRIVARAAELAAEAGDPATASALRREAIATYAGQSAALAADALRASNDPALDPFAAAQAYRAVERWNDAIAMLDRAIAAGQNEAEALRQRGLARRALGDFAGALADLAAARDRDPNSDTGRQAALDWIQTYGQSGMVAEAAARYRQYALEWPDDPRAPVALDRAAQLYDRLGDGATATDVRLELGQRYLTTMLGIAALHRVALARFDSGDLAGASELWRALAQRGQGIGQALGAFWAGKAAQQLGDPAAADYFRQAQAAAPDSYYAARAAEALGEIPSGPIPIGAPIDAADWIVLAEWVQSWSASEVQSSLASVAERARLLREVGLYNEADSEWLDGLRQAGEEPLRLLDLAQRAYQAGATYPALLAAERLARLAPPAANPPPPALLRLRFPTPYPELVQREAAAFGVDPLLFYALIRQESLFNPAATSWVGARGLAQIMPDTGRGIAQNLGVSDFQLDDLYRPHVSIRFGAFYLGRRIRDMNGSLHGALAAYNGGLGNAQRWAGGNVVADPDRFVETIDFSETRNYVWAVYAFYGVYRGIYTGE
ncbi:lytic transglycosylase [Chloroflexus islandicus]|uniref:Lytic transglycosylase n=1 Tax=Chloroflexus islandicus TaxID=1707952 RepID=A0A178MDZ0_9CHLR|nr:lytic transglycosylase domain-containing protein [Chloroflexus islandicus]OAN46248.1 lytic transglycosylase [Chloroflexus islandicus]